MVTFVLDASAVLRYLDDEAGAGRVEAILTAHLDGRSAVVISAIHWGEVMGILWKRHGLEAAESTMRDLRSMRFAIVAATAERSQRAAVIRHKLRMPYADAFGVELAGDSPEHIFVTADFDAKPAEKHISIEFLPTKPRA